MPNPKLLSEGIDHQVDFEGEYEPGKKIKRICWEHLIRRSKLKLENIFGDFPAIQKFPSCMKFFINWAENRKGNLSWSLTAGRVKYSKVWAKYEGKIAFLEIADERIDQMLKDLPAYALAVLENYYMANNCFLKEGELLNNTDKLADIPVIIINGRYDMICPPITAYKLHKKLPKSKLIIVERAGHSAIEPGIQAELVKAMPSFED